MAVQVNLVDDSIKVDNSLDSIVIIENIVSIRGGKSLDVTGYPLDVLQAGHVIIKENSSGNYKPMPATAASKNGVATVGGVTAGSGYTNGTYENVPLSGGTGSGALATVVIAGTVVSTVTITKPGKDYTVTDVLAIPASYAGGTGTGGSVPVASVADNAAAYGALPDSHTYAGILVSTILTKLPFAGVMTWGVVNENASPFPVASIKSAFIAAVSNIEFRGDLS